MVLVSAAMDADVLYGAWQGSALLYRSFLDARLCQLYPWRRHAADLARDLERATIPRLPSSPADRQTARGVRPVRPAVEPLMAEPRPRIAVVIPTLNEEAPIGAVVRAVPRDIVDEIIVADSGSTDSTVERARAAGARIVRETQ